MSLLFVHPDKELVLLLPAPPEAETCKGVGLWLTLEKNAGQSEKLETRAFEEELERGRQGALD